MDRRSFLQVGALSCLASFAKPNLGRGAGIVDQPKILRFYNLHTAEQLKTTYWADGRYVPESLAEINHILRDFRTGEVFQIAPNLLDTLHELNLELDSQQPYEIISGFRSPKTNALLRGQSHGVAQNSLHMKGMAADVRVPGRTLEKLRRAAISLRAGGVGYYPSSQFVHIDVGRIRAW